MKLSATALLAALAVGLATPSPAHAQTCGWFAVGACTRAAAGYPSNPMGWAIVNTSQVEGFRSGFFCVASGPQGRSGAQRDRDALRAMGVRGAYIKRGCALFGE